MGKELFLELSDLCWVNFVQESSDTTVDDGNLLLNWHRDILTLRQDLNRTGRKQQPLCTGPTRASWNQRPASWTWSEQQIRHETQTNRH